MTINILKKDMKRKKTMNVILLLFITLCTVFLASSVSNIVIVSNGIEFFAQRSHLADYLIFTGSESSDEFREWLLESEYVIEFSKDETFNIPTSDVLIRGSDEYDEIGGVLISTLPDMFNFPLNEADEVITQINRGDMIISFSQANRHNIQIGDELTLLVGDERHSFVVRQLAKDMLLGSDIIASTRFFIHEDDFNEMSINEGGNQLITHIYSIRTTDLTSFSNSLTGADHLPSDLALDRHMIENLYLFELIIFAILALMSIFLVVISFIVLRFAIIFTLQEDKKEIGIMKAIGLKNYAVKRIYLIKYFFLSVIGAILGFILSFPLGAMLMRDLSQTMALSDSRMHYLIQSLCAILIVLLVMLFSYISTRKINQLTAIQAIREGETGERTKKAGLLKLHKKRRMPTVLYLSLNDILSNVKSYVVLLFVFILCYLLVVIPTNAINNLINEQALELLGIAPADVFIETDQFGTLFGFEGSVADLEEELLAFQNFYLEHGIEITIQTDLLSSGASIYLDPDEAATINIYQGVLISAEEYSYLRGVAPMLPHEIAVSEVTLAAIGADIGDEVYIAFREHRQRYLITGSIQLLNNFGQGARFSQTATAWDDALFSTLAVGVRFVNRDNISGQIEQLRDLSPEIEIVETEEILRTFMGMVVDIILGVQQVILIIVLVTILLITLLMSISFFARDISQIALLKNMGFKNHVIRAWQGLRMIIVMVVALVIGMILIPATNVLVRMIFGMMGAPQIETHTDVLLVHLLYPVIFLVTVCIATLVVTGYVKKIKLRDMGVAD